MTEITQQIAQHLNEQGAEMSALKIILLGLVARITVADPMFAEEQIEQMRSDALGALARTPSNPGNSPEDEQQIQTMIALEIENFFRRLSVAVSAIRNSSGQSGRN